MKNSMGLTGESSDHKLAAIFDSESDARAALDRLVDATGLDKQQVAVIGPDDESFGRQLEPESRGIWYTLIRAHLWLGLVGAAIGAAAYGIMALMGVPFVTDNPGKSAMIIFYCFLVGLLFGGLVTVRPDHNRYVREAKAALAEGKSLLVVHARSLKELRRAKSSIEKAGTDVVSTV